VGPRIDIRKYLFGSFTRGASVEDEGDRAIEPDTCANFGKRSGQYAATHTELELEYARLALLLALTGLAATSRGRYFSTTC
jgi:hypothetical protein